MTIRFNELMIIGLSLIPGSFILAFIAAAVFSFLEIGALAAAAWAFFPTIIAGVVLLLLGIGMEIH